MKVLLENLLRFEDGSSVTKDDIEAVVDWQNDKGAPTTRSPIARRAC
jgi:aconitate hydratase